jgi:hypothetical protein
MTALSADHDHDHDHDHGYMVPDMVPDMVPGWGYKGSVGDDSLSNHPPVWHSVCISNPCRGFISAGFLSLVPGLELVIMVPYDFAVRGIIWRPRLQYPSTGVVS